MKTHGDTAPIKSQFLTIAPKTQPQAFFRLKMPVSALFKA